jgi:hypothetical protein
MTTFTTQDRVDAEITVEPIPFAGFVQLQDKVIYKTFEEWKAGQWLEDGEPRTKAYTKDELLLIEMGWKYGFDAGKAQDK